MSLPGISLLADTPASFWFPPKASTFAEETDALYMIILWISIIFFVGIVVAMVVFVAKFRRRPGYQGDSRALHNNALEITWTVIPTIIVCFIFARGVEGYMDMMTPPPNTLDINVTASKWNWAFQYPNGAVSDQLHVPIDQPVRLRMRSEDVLHAFYVPAFRAKTDVVPGRVNILWFEPILEGSYDLFCAEYCGDQHSEMIKRQGVVVHKLEEYEAWVANAAKPPVNPVAHGFWLYKRHGCIACHSVTDGKRIVGPPFGKTYGKTFKNTKGQTVTFDEQYIQESVLNPQAQMREGYQTASQMPSFLGKLSNEEIVAITSFLQSLQKDEFIAAFEDGDLSDGEKSSLGIEDQPEDAAEAEPASSDQQ
ncbi:MAG: cytochrome c oxidase subunit II [Planctomycetales bacterium]|nr:cytochrome c oxidase subunit II [Planctomycetales bacterium]